MAASRVVKAIQLGPKILTQLDEHCWTGGVPAPWAYVELTLWKYLYQCTPMELERIIEAKGVRGVLLDLAMVNLVEARRMDKLRK